MLHLPVARMKALIFKASLLPSRENNRCYRVHSMSQALFGVMINLLKHKLVPRARQRIRPVVVLILGIKRPVVEPVEMK